MAATRRVAKSLVHESVLVPAGRARDDDAALVELFTSHTDAIIIPFFEKLNEGKLNEPGRTFCGTVPDIHGARPAPVPIPAARYGRRGGMT
jgi:hypothetical protein